MNVNKLLMAGVGVAVGMAIFATAIRLTENFAPQVSNYFKDAFGRV